MEYLHPTVKRDLTLFSVQAWQQGYGKFFAAEFGKAYPIFFYYDGFRVNFYHTERDFEFFKKILVPGLINAPHKFNRLNEGFLNDINFLKNTALSAETLPKIFEVVGRVMMLYLFIVGDSFVKAMPAAMESRLASEGILYELDLAVLNRIKKHLTTAGLDPAIAHVCAFSEIMDLISGKPIDADGISKRRGGYIAENEKLLAENDFEKFCSTRGLMSHEWSAETGSATLIGQTAYPGQAEGTVRIVANAGEVGKVMPGDILVAAMTNANYLPAIRIASAVVTDEGGVTCHAAIVARELKKPCIVGTKNATRLLKDGERIAVNADAGIIKIIA